MQKLVQVISKLLKPLKLLKKFLAVCVWLIVVLFIASCTHIPPEDHPETSGAHWSHLFQPDLSNTIKPEGVWSFENEVLTATEDKHLWTAKEYSDFILDLEFKTAPGTNSGVIVHGSNINSWVANSVEIQIADDFHEKWANSPATWQCGAIFGHKAANMQAVKEPGAWNRFTITCKGNMIWVVLNGEQINEIDLSLWTSAETNPDGSEIPEWLNKPLAELPTKGHVGFQGKHAGAPVYFRNIKIKEL